MQAPLQQQKKNSTTSLLQCITLLHNTSKYSYNCRERPEVPRLVTLADNMKVPLDVDFSVMFPLFPIWRSVVNSHSNQSHHLSSSIRLLIWSILMSENGFDGALNCLCRQYESSAVVESFFMLLLFPIWSSMVNSYSTWRNHLPPNIRLLIWSMLMSEMGSMGLSSSISEENFVRSRLFSSVKQSLQQDEKGNTYKN